MNWQPHTVRPKNLETALIAVIPAQDDINEGNPFLLGEIYYFDHNHGAWMGETNGLLLKHKAYYWLPEDQLILSLPK
jgi:hypothetical protein